MTAIAIRRFATRLGPRVFVIGLGAVATSLGAQQVSYSRAEQLLNWNTTLLVSGDEVQPLQQEP